MQKIRYNFLFVIGLMLILGATDRGFQPEQTEQKRGHSHGQNIAEFLSGQG